MNALYAPVELRVTQKNPEYIMFDASHDLGGTLEAYHRIGTESLVISDLRAHILRQGIGTELAKSAVKLVFLHYPHIEFIQAAIIDERVLPMISKAIGAGTARFFADEGLEDPLPYHSVLSTLRNRQKTFAAITDPDSDFDPAVYAMVAFSELDMKDWPIAQMIQ